MSSTLQRIPGTNSLSIEPLGWTAPEGSFVFCFGSDEAGREGYFAVADGVEIAQSDTFGGARFIRSKARLRGPVRELPTGWTWEAYAVVNGDEMWTFELFRGETRDLSDLAINTQGLAGSITLTFGLRVVGPALAEPVNLEIPAFYLDENILDVASSSLIVANRSPEVGATGVDQDAEISFDLMDTDEEPDPDATQVYVDGVLAWDGLSGAQPGYTVVVSNPSTGTLRYSIAAPYLFESLREVPVRVVSATSLHTLDTTWSFTIEDLTAPRVLSASSTAHDVVRVTFDEPVLLGTVAANYTFERLEAPSVAVVAVSVVQVSPTVFDVTLDIPITRGLLYRVTVADVTDLLGNEIVAPYDFADFIGFACADVAGRDFALWEMIPEVVRGLDTSRDLYKMIAVLQEVVDLLLCDIDRWTDILDVDVAAERYLDQMLIGLGNPFSFDLTVEEKRRLVAVLVDMYALKGTAPGIISVVRFFLGIEITIRAYSEESWILGESELGIDTDLGPGTSRERYSFEVVSPIDLTDAQREQITDIVEYMKPAHTHLVRIVEPADVIVVDHLELGLSELGGDEWMLH